MPKVIVWKCPHTGKLFEDKTKYKSYLSNLAKERRVQRKLQEDRDQARAWWDQAQDIEMSIEDFQQWIIDNQMQFWKDSAAYNTYDWKDVGKKTRGGVVMPIPELVSFTEFRLTWSDTVSNTHSCPHNGVTNWGVRNPNAPIGYPGWCGRFSWRCKWPKEFAGVYLPGDIFDGKDCRINTGSGGGGGMIDGYMHHAFSIEIFAADWPGLARYREKKLMWEILKTNYA
jgi:hypothetical protein